jgi:hypothetical protein
MQRGDSAAVVASASQAGSDAWTIFEFLKVQMIEDVSYVRKLHGIQA